MSVLLCAIEADKPPPSPLAGVQVSIFRWPDGRVDVESIVYSPGLREDDYEAAECPPDGLGLAVAAAVARIVSFAAGGKGGGR